MRNEQGADELLAAYVRQLVDAFPPLTKTQEDRIRLLLRPHLVALHEQRQREAAGQRSGRPDSEIRTAGSASAGWARTRAICPPSPPHHSGTRPSAMNPEQIARVVHEANRALQHIQGDPTPSPPWDQAPQSQRQSALEGVLDALAGSTPAELHRDWVTHKLRSGWRYGPVKDEAAKTHPCMVPYDELPNHQKLKDRMFIAIVDALRNGNDRPA